MNAIARENDIVVYQPASTIKNLKVHGLADNAQTRTSVGSSISRAYHTNHFPSSLCVRNCRIPDAECASSWVVGTVLEVTSELLTVSALVIICPGHLLIHNSR